jgi:hypothetical protein
MRQHHVPVAGSHRHRAELTPGSPAANTQRGDLLDTLRRPFLHSRAACVSVTWTVAGGRLRHSHPSPCRTLRHPASKRRWSISTCPFARWLSTRAYPFARCKRHLSSAEHCLLCYRIGRRVLVKRSEFDAWMLEWRQAESEAERMVRRVLGNLDTGWVDLPQPRAKR